MTFKKINIILNKISMYAMNLSILFLTISAFFITLQVFLRYLFSYSFPWAEELSRYLVIYVILLASALVLQEDSNPRVEIFYETFPKKVRFYLNCFFYILILIFLVILGWQGTKAVISSLHDYTAALRIPWAVPYFAIPLGSVLMILQIPQLFIQNYENNWL